MKKNLFLAGLCMSCILFSCTQSRTGAVHIAPAPDGEPLNADFKVTVDGQTLPVFNARVGAVERIVRDKSLLDRGQSIYELTAYGYFDMEGSVRVKVTYKEDVRTVKILPSSAGISATVSGCTVTFTLDRPRYLTVEINGDVFHPLHLLADAPETDVPDKNSPDVIFFEPGVHEITHLELTDNQTLYISPGAIVRAVVQPPGPYPPVVLLKGKNIRVCGRGVLDASLSPLHTRSVIRAEDSENVRIEGLILHDSPGWTVPIDNSEQVLVKNLKLFGYRANSDGIDICSSRHVEVADCFLRTMDDLVVIKTKFGKGVIKDVRVHGCVLWNQSAHVLSIGAELRQDVSNVVFEDCDVIHDFGREWTLRIYHCDKALVSDIRFENIRVEESVRLISLWIDSAVWSRDAERGHIRNVTFKNIHAFGEPMTVELKGYDKDHAIENVNFENVTRYGKPLTREVVKMNEFVENVSFRHMSDCSQSCTKDEGLSPFGILVHLEGGGENNTMIGHLDMVAKMGARWNRVDFTWSNIERPQGEWNFETHDRIIDRLLEQHIQPQAILLYDVPWAHPAHKHLDAWLTYVEKTVTRYKDRVRYWEVWNEPNLVQFWENPDPADYATLLKATYRKIKEIDPELTVLYAGTSGIPLDFIEKSFRAGAVDCFDRIAFHPYRGEFNTMERVAGYGRDIHALQNLLEKYGVGDRKLWITEMGLSSWQTVNPSTIEMFHAMKRQKEPDKVWKIALFYDDSYPAGNTMTAGEIMALFENRKDFSVENMGYPDLATIDVSKYDALLSPMMENYPALLFEQGISPSVGYLYFRGRLYFYGNPITEENQAAFLPQAILLSVRFGVERFIWYEFHSSERNPFEREYFFSLVHHPNLELKPAYYAYQTLAGVFPEGSRIDASVEWNRTDFCVVSWIHPDGTHVWALWTPSGTKQVSLKMGKGFRKALDYTGKELPVAADTQTMELTPGITYLVGPRTLDIK